MAVSPYPSPNSADQLACDLSPISNPDDYTAWWAAVPGNSTYANWFWNDIVPNNSATACRSTTANTFWTQAVPANWVPIPNIGGWPWSAGGYYTQWFWLHAVPDNWALVSNIGGWPWPAGGYYTQWFWLHAVPDNWAFVSNIGGWSWPAGGYYTQWFWLHAAPDNWAFVSNIGGWPWSAGGYYTQWFWLHAAPDNWAFVSNIGGWPWPAGGYYTQWFWLHAVADNWVQSAGLGLGHLPAPTADPNYVQFNQGYFRYWFWEGAVPDDWGPVGDIGGWLSPTGGYYTQWFWLHAAPENWAARGAMAIGGTGQAGYYDYTFYHFATVRDFAWRNSLSIAGSQGAGYFDYWFHGYFGQSVAHYKQLLSLAGGYLGNASTFLPVSSWYNPNAQAAVVLTFDTEGSETETCAVTRVLRQQGVPGTFYLVGTTADSLTPGWIQCLSGMDIEDHTVDHPGAFDLAPHTFLDTFTNAEQVYEISGDVARVRAKIPSATMTSFRTPWCDGNKTFDGSVIQNSIASGMKSDRSVATIPAFARQAGVLPPFGLTLFSLSAFPSPFVIGTQNGNQLVEFPFTYPSDWTASAIHGLDSSHDAPFPGAPGYAVTVWEKEFDEIYSQGGVMVVLMHPWLQAPGGQYPDGLNALITYLKSKPGVAFTTMAGANQSYRTALQYLERTRRPQSPK